MDWLKILEQYGVPLVVAAAFWWFIQKQNKYIQEELSKELRESFSKYILTFLVFFMHFSKKFDIVIVLM